MLLGVTTFRAVTLLRALSHLALVLALLGVVIAPAQAVGWMPIAQAHAHDAHAGHGGTTAFVDHAAHDHGAPADSLPVHEPDACKTACCISTASHPLPVNDASAILFFASVSYGDAAQSASGRADAPEPGIPKRLA